MAVRLRTSSQSQAMLRRRPKKHVPALYSPSRPAEEEETRFRARLDYILDPENEDINQELLSQLRAKDSLIAQLNARLVSATVSLKQTETAAVKDKQILQLLEEKGSMAKELALAEFARDQAEGARRELDRQATTDREQADLLNEALIEELESLKSQLRSKSDQLLSAKQDILDLSKIIDDINKLNFDLNEKVKSLNEEMEKNNAEHYKATAKAGQIEELEQELIATKTEVQRLQAALANAQKDSSQLKELRQLIYTSVDTIVGHLGKVSTSSQESLSALQTIDTQVHELSKFSLSPSKGTAEKIASLKQTVKEQQLEIESQKRAASKAVSASKVHEHRVQVLQAEAEKANTEHASAAATLKNRVELVLSNLQASKTARNEVETKLEHCMAELQKKQTENAFITEKLKKLQSKTETFWKTQEDLSNTCHDLKLSLLQVQAEKFSLESATHTLDKKLRAAVAEAAALTEELWLRDNDVLRREARKVKLQQEVDGLKLSLTTSHSKLQKKIMGETMNINVRLEEKEKQVVALRRMLKMSEQRGEAELAAVADRLEELVETARDLAAGDDTQRKEALTKAKALQRMYAGILDFPLPEETLRSRVQLKSLLEETDAGTMTVAHVLLRVRDICN